MTVDEALERAGSWNEPSIDNAIALHARPSIVSYHDIKAMLVLAAEVKRLEAGIQHWYDKVEAMKQLASSWS